MGWGMGGLHQNHQPLRFEQTAFRAVPQFAGILVLYGKGKIVPSPLQVVGELEVFTLASFL